MTASCTAKNKQFDYDFAKLAIKGRESMGNVLTKYPVRKVTQKSAGVSTLGGVEIWYDSTIGRLNRDEHGTLIGNFEPKDLILAIYKSGNYELTNFELTNRYPAEEIVYLKKFNPSGIISAIYFDGQGKHTLIKRFKLETSTVDKKFLFITDHKASKLIAVTDNYQPNVQIKHKPDGKTLEIEILPIDDLVDVRGWKAIGNKLNYNKLMDLEFIDTELKQPEEEQEIIAQEEKNEETSIELEEKVEPIKAEIEEPEFVIKNLPEEITKTDSDVEDIPFEIKNLPNESNEKSNSGEQLGLF